MHRSKKYFTQDQILNRIKQGYGEGQGQVYKPWLGVQDVPSEGRSHRIYSHHTKRVHQLFSDLERTVFITIDWKPSTLDIREQFPLILDDTLDIAKEAGIHHPEMEGIKQVMTSDFLVDTADKNRPKFVLQAKYIRDLEDKRTIEKLEIEHSLTGKVYLEKSSNPDGVSVELLDSNRRKWRKLVKKSGPKQARSNSFGGAVYAWLYRHDRQWLLDVNAEFKLARTTQNYRVDWIKRDKEVEEQLRKIIEENRNNPECPRRTKNWLLLQTPKGPSNSKNLNKLPLTSAFLNTASETVSEYQVRRLERAVKYLELAGEEVKRWTILRMAGLSKQRITPPAQEVIDSLELI